MKAICVTPTRTLELRDIPAPDAPSRGHIIVDMAASAINHGDKAFLKMPGAIGSSLALGPHGVWGASGAGRVVAVGDGVPAEYMGRNVAIYRSLDRSAESIGLWSERSHVRYTNCVILPDNVDARDYAGSLVNVMTAYAFLEEITEAGHKGVIATAGSSATALALASLARHRSLPAIFLARTEAAREELQRLGIEHVIVTDETLAERLAALAAELGTTAVFDGVGGELLGRIAPSLPMRSTIYTYGFLGGNTPVSIPSLVFMAKDLTVRRFSNFESPTVKDPARLVAALQALDGIIGEPLFRTRLGKEFTFDQIDEAMAYAPSDGSKAVLVA